MLLNMMEEWRVSWIFSSPFFNSFSSCRYVPVKCCPQESLPARPSTMLPEEVSGLQEPPNAMAARGSSSIPEAGASPEIWNRRGQKRDSKSCLLMFSFFFPEFFRLFVCGGKIANQGWSTSENSFGQLEWTSWPWLNPALHSRQRIRPKTAARLMIGRAHPRRPCCTLTVHATTVTFSNRVVVSNTVCLIFTPDWILGGMIQFDYIVNIFHMGWFNHQLVLGMQCDHGMTR